MEVEKSASNTKQENESFKGISLVFSKTIQKPRLTSSATTWASEEIKMKCIFNKGIAFCSNDTMRRNLSTEINVQDPKLPSKTIVQQTNDEPCNSSSNLTEDYLEPEPVNKSKTQFAADIYSLVKSSSNMLILEEMKANENIYNLHLGTIYSQPNEDIIAANESSLNINEIHKPDMDKLETEPPKEKEDDTNRLEEHTDILLSTGEEVKEIKDMKNRLNTTALGPGVLTVAYLSESSIKTLTDDGSVDKVSVIEPTLRVLADEIKVSIKDSADSSTIVSSKDNFNFANSINSKTRDAILSIGSTSYHEDFARISKLPPSRKLPKALSVIQETGYSGGNFSDSLLQSQSDSKLDLKTSEDVKLIRSDSAINTRKSLYKIKLEPEASTSTYKQMFKSLMYSTEDETLITIEKNENIGKEEPSDETNKLKISDPIGHKNDDNNVQCGPF